MALRDNGNLIVTSDVHISLGSDPRLVKQFCGFLERLARAGTAACKIFVIAGDLFDFDLPDPNARADECQDPSGTLLKILTGFPALETGFTHVLEAGIDMVILAGNHDIELFTPNVAELFRRAILSHATGGHGRASGLLDLSSPEFARLSPDLHIEHGNRFDEDNMFDAASFDLVREGGTPVFPLGSCLERRLLRKLPWLDYGGFSSNTPWPVLMTVFKRHGISGGLNVIFRYYVTSLELLKESLRRRCHLSREKPTDRRTLSSPVRTFRRLYLDRSIVFMAAALWIILAPWGLHAAMPIWLAGTGSLGLILLSLASLRGGNRYRSSASFGCEKGAREVMADPNITTVIMGHAHEPADVIVDARGRRYLNTGAFMNPSPEGFPYILVVPCSDGYSATLCRYL